MKEHFNDSLSVLSSLVENISHLLLLCFIVRHDFSLKRVMCLYSICNHSEFVVLSWSLVLLTLSSCLDKKWIRVRILECCAANNG